MDAKNSSSKLFDVPVTVSNPLLCSNNPKEKIIKKYIYVKCDCKRRTSYEITIMDLPRVIMVEILSRLPIKPIFRCKSVCKRWYNLVSHDPLFVKLYHSTSHFPCILLSVDDSGFGGSVSSILELKANYDYNSRPRNRPIMLSPKFHLPHLKWKIFEDGCYTTRIKPNLKLVGSCNGFICLLNGATYDAYYHSVYISNPLLGEYFQLELPEWEKRIRHVAYGFCYGQASGQYKVLRSVTRKFRGRPEVSTLEVYTLGVDEKWRNVGEALRPLWSFGNVNVNGAIHWLNDVEDPKECAGIHSFNIETEKVQTVPSPPGLENGSFSLSLVELRNCLCLSDNCYSLHIDIWWMKEYGVAESWTRDRILMEFIPPNIHYEHHSLIPIVIWKDGEILMQSDRGTELASYSPKDEKFRKVKVHGGGKAATRYTPSFCSLKTIMGESFQISNVYPKTEIV